MPDEPIPETNWLPNAHWGTADTPLPEWRADPASDPGEDDDEDQPTQPDLLRMLGMTPEAYAALLASFNEKD